MENKKCNKCKEIKPVSEFQKESRAKNGYKPRCKKCINEYNSLYYKNVYSSKKLTLSKLRYQKIKDDPKEKQRRSDYCKLTYKSKREYNMEYQLLNKEKISKQRSSYHSLKIKDNDYRIEQKLRRIIYRLKVGRGTKIDENLNYSVEDFKNHIKVYPSINFSIDHKIPISWFRKDTPISIINSLDNLHVIDSHINLTKKNKYCHPVVMSYYKIAINYIKDKYKLL